VVGKVKRNAPTTDTRYMEWVAIDPMGLWLNDLNGEWATPLTASGFYGNRPTRGLPAQLVPGSRLYGNGPQMITDPRHQRNRTCKYCKLGWRSVVAREEVCALSKRKRGDTVAVVNERHLGSEGGQVSKTDDPEYAAFGSFSALVTKEYVLWSTIPVWLLFLCTL